MLPLPAEKKKHHKTYGDLRSNTSSRQPTGQGTDGAPEDRLCALKPWSVWCGSRLAIKDHEEWSKDQVWSQDHYAIGNPLVSLVTTRIIDDWKPTKKKSSRPICTVHPVPVCDWKWNPFKTKSGSCRLFAFETCFLCLVHWAVQLCNPLMMTHALAQLRSQ